MTMVQLRNIRFKLCLAIDNAINIVMGITLVKDNDNLSTEVIGTQMRPSDY